MSNVDRPGPGFRLGGGELLKLAVSKAARTVSAPETDYRAIFYRSGLKFAGGGSFEWLTPSEQSEREATSDLAAISSDAGVRLSMAKDAGTPAANVMNDEAAARFESLFSTEIIPEILRNGIETGVSSPADEVLRAAASENRLATFSALNSMFIKNLSRPNIAASIVILASRLPVQHANSIGLTMAMAACAQRSVEIVEAGIMAIESWKLPEGAEVLRLVQPSVTWLHTYRDAVLGTLDGP